MGSVERIALHFRLPFGNDSPLMRRNAHRFGSPVPYLGQKYGFGAMLSIFRQLWHLWFFKSSGNIRQGFRLSDHVKYSLDGAMNECIITTRKSGGNKGVLDAVRMHHT